MDYLNIVINIDTTSTQCIPITIFKKYVLFITFCITRRFNWNLMIGNTATWIRIYFQRNCLVVIFIWQHLHFSVTILLICWLSGKSSLGLYYVSSSVWLSMLCVSDENFIALMMGGFVFYGEARVEAVVIDASEDIITCVFFFRSCSVLVAIVQFSYTLHRL